MYVDTKIIWDKLFNRQEMEALTFKAFLFYLIYCPLFILGVITLEDIKQLVLLAFLVITGSWRFYRWLVRDDQNRRLKELQIEEKEIELVERQLKIEIKKKEMSKIN